MVRQPGAVGAAHWMRAGSEIPPGVARLSLMVGSNILPRYRLRLLICFFFNGPRCGVVGQQKKRAVLEVAVRRFGGGETSPRWRAA